MTAFAITAVEAALRTWLTTSTGLAEGEVIWANQPGDQPASGRFMTVRPAVFSPASPTTESQYRDHPTPTPGAELVRTSRVPAVLSVYVQANSSAVAGSLSGFELARLAQVGLSMVAVQTALEAAGLSVADPGQPRDISGILDQRFQSRWALDVRFNCTSELSEALTFIETFSGVGEVIGPDGTIYEIPFGTPPPPP